MELSKKIRMASTYAGISTAELARRIDSTPQSLCNRLKNEKFTPEELEKMADALGAKFEMNFVFPDGTKI